MATVEMPQPMKVEKGKAQGIEDKKEQVNIFYLSSHYADKMEHEPPYYLQVVNKQLGDLIQRLFDKTNPKLISFN